MNGDKALAETFSQNVNVPESVEAVICPPAILIAYFQSSRFKLGAQNCSHLENGAHTGDISAAMLKEAGCDYVIVGHSERRSDHGESSELVAQKALSVLNENMTPIICVGESLEERESGRVNDIIGAQLNAVFTQLSVEQLSMCVIAYEPVWAIGTGKTATPEQAQEVHEFIRDSLSRVDSGMASKVRIVYGGSMKPENAAMLLSQPDIDGGLIGGASLKKDEFSAICQAAG